MRGENKPSPNLSIKNLKIPSAQALQCIAVWLEVGVAMAGLGGDLSSGPREAGPLDPVICQGNLSHLVPSCKCT